MNLLYSNIIVIEFQENHFLLTVNYLEKVKFRVTFITIKINFIYLIDAHRKKNLLYHKNEHKISLVSMRKSYCASSYKNGTIRTSDHLLHLKHLLLHTTIQCAMQDQLQHVSK